jgi:hypothetical protein
MYAAQYLAVDFAWHLGANPNYSRRGVARFDRARLLAQRDGLGHPALFAAGLGAIQ